MTPHGIVTPAIGWDAHELDAKLRPEDRRELEDLSGGEALRSLLLGVATSSPALTFRDLNGDLAGIVGVVPVSPLHGVVWMAGTPLIEQRKAAFLRGSLDLMAHFDRRFDTLFNVCDARNEVHHRWLHWLGFTFIRKIDQYGPRKVPVFEFARISPSAIPSQ